MAAETYQLVISGQCAGQFVQNILHYRMDDASFSSRLAAAKGLVLGWEEADLGGAWVSLLPVPYVINSVKARRITNGGGPEYISVALQGSAGLQGTNVQTSSAGPVLLWHTNGPNRSVGKTFLAGIGTTNVEGGEISASFLAILFEFATDLRQSFPAVGGSTPTCDMVIPKTGDPSTRYLVDGVQISKDIGKLRRRQLPV